MCSQACVSLSSLSCKNNNFSFVVTNLIAPLANVSGHLLALCLLIFIAMAARRKRPNRLLIDVPLKSIEDAVEPQLIALCDQKLLISEVCF